MAKPRPRHSLKYQKLSAENRRVIQYWRQSLYDAERAEAATSGGERRPSDVRLEELVRGHCSPSVFRDLERSIGDKDALPQRDSRFKEDSQRWREVLLCPIRLRRDEQNFFGPRTIDPFWIPARLQASGELLPPERGVPWIARSHLEPIVADEIPTFGTVDDLEEFTIHSPYLHTTNWAEYWKYADELFKAVTGESLTDFALDGYVRARNGLVVQDRVTQGMNTALLRVYDEVLTNRRPPGVVVKLARTKDPKRKPFSREKSSLARYAMRHCGHFNNSYPLAYSQRLALCRYFESSASSVLPVTGPPGTGKTTLIQDLVASLFVRSAISGETSPPVIVCTGATNQSVMNVIDSFGQADVAPGPLAGRWLPEVKSYGSFCASKTRAEIVSGYHLELRDGNGFSEGMENLEYLDRAESEFLSRCSEFAGKSLTLKGAIRYLQNQLRKDYQKLIREISQARGGSVMESVKSLLGFSPSCSVEEFLSGVEPLDCSTRHRLFQIATHYWEGRWLVAAREEISMRARMAASKTEFRGLPDSWRLRAMVTPVFVSTLAMIPRFFWYDRASTQVPIDLLIVDEASLVPPELGGVGMVLAKRALVIGDPLQLEPVWNIPLHVDRANAEELNLLKSRNDKEWEALSKRGILASIGSLMRLALRAAEKIEENFLGVFLSEHRRGVPEIVAVVNDLAYRGRLIPKREALSNRILPALGYVHVPGSSERAGRSRINRREAKEILSWLEENEERVRAYYDNRPLSEIVAVISPFAAHIRELKKSLPKRHQKMIVGTVQALQGAERPIVIFSSVYDRHSANKMFFDRGVNLLNVAITRAEDSFLVFGDMNIFNPRETYPSSVLARHLFASDENEISRANATFVAEIPDAEIRRLATLEEHRAVLFEAFNTARRELLIVSPTISIVAIERDKIADLVRDTVSRGVKVAIFVDEDLNSLEGQLKEPAMLGIEAMRNAGAELHIAQRIHNKSLAIDNHTLVDGSFNWLSAVRGSGHRHQKFEVSFLYRGPDANREIQHLRDELRYRSL